MSHDQTTAGRGAAPATAPSPSPAPSQSQSATSVGAARAAVVSRAQQARDAGYTARAAVPEDAAELGELHVAVWRQTYRGIMPDEVLDVLDPVARGERWSTIIAGGEVRGSAGVRATTLVAVAPDGRLAGFASYGPSRDDDPPTPLELWALNTLAAHHGSGMAQLLVSESIGDDAASLWVADGNERAIAFYRRIGFEHDGTVHDDADLQVRELRMVRGRQA